MAAGRFLIVTWDGGGNLPPSLALAARLVDAGHEVVLIADEAPTAGSTAARVAQSGARFVAYSSVAPKPAEVSTEDSPVRSDDIRNGVDSAKDVLAAAQDLQADALVVDCMSGAGLVAAERTGLPTAVLVHVLYQPFICHWADRVVDVTRSRSALGMAPFAEPRTVLQQFEHAAKVLALMPEDLDYPGAPRTKRTHYVGPILDPRVPDLAGDLGFDRSDDRPLVLVSLGTTHQRQREALPPILEALGRLPVRGLVTRGGVDIGEQALPPNVVLHDYIPHASVLRQASAVVTHGGLGTILAALAHGVPLVCIPQGKEQPLNAERVQACGAGINLPTDASPSAIEGAIAALMHDRYKDAAKSMSELIQRHGAGNAAVEHIQGLLSGRRSQGR